VFICFEGIDGAGKSTQSRMLYQRMQKSGRAVELVADPGTTKIGTAIRQILLHNDAPISPVAQMLLFSAARAELAAYISELQANDVDVICDRWLLSTLVYQGTINKISLDLIIKIFCATTKLEPDLCVVLDIDPDATTQRAQRLCPAIGSCTAPAHKDRYERLCLREKKKMRAAYLEHATTRPYAKNVFIVDGALPPDEVHEAVFAALQRVIAGECLLPAAVPL
jgi:dTMP kinase